MRILTPRHSTASKLALALLLAPAFALAAIDAPDHVIYGNVTVFGAPASYGTLIEARTWPGDVRIARYELGRQQNLGAQFALRVKMDAVDPRRTGYARTGDPVRLYVGNQLAAETVVGAEGVAVRLDLDPQGMGTGPSVIVDDVARFEGNSEPVLVNFPVRMNTTSGDAVSIEWSTANGTASGGVSCGPNVDFVQDDGVTTLAPGALQGTISVLVCGDTLVESDETFTVNLTRVVNGVPARGAVTGTILDDDDVPSISVLAARVAEPTSGTAPANFLVRLSRSSASDVRFDFATQDMSAVAGLDYVASSGTVTVPAGSIEAMLAVSVLADAAVEPTEQFRVLLSNPVQGRLAQPSVLGTIEDPGHDPLLGHDGDLIGGEGGLVSLAQPSAIVLSPDDAHVYVASESGDRILHLTRGAAGDLVFVAAYAGSDAALATARLDGPTDLRISGDGKFLYAAAHAGDALLVFQRGADGALTWEHTQANNVADETATGGTVRGLDGARALALSPDDAHLYAAGADGDTLAVFARDATTGRLRFLEAETNGVDDAADAGSAPMALDQPAAIVVSPDGAQVYVAARFGNALLTFARDGAGTLSFVSAHRDGQLGIEGLGGAAGLAITPDGKHLYVASESDNALALYDRGSDGALVPRKLWTKGTGGINGLGGAQAVTLSHDGSELYVAGFGDHSVTAFARVTADDAAPGRVEGDLQRKQTLFDGDPGLDRLAGPVAVAVSHDDRNVYVAANIDNAIVRFRRLGVTDPVFSDDFE